MVTLPVKRLVMRFVQRSGNSYIASKKDKNYVFPSPTKKVNEKRKVKQAAGWM